MSTKDFSDFIEHTFINYSWFVIMGPKALCFHHQKGFKQELLPEYLYVLSNNIISFIRSSWSHWTSVHLHKFNEDFRCPAGAIFLVIKPHDDEDISVPQRACKLCRAKSPALVLGSHGWLDELDVWKGGWPIPEWLVNDLASRSSWYRRG